MPIKPVSTFILAAVVSDQPYLNSVRTLKESRILLIPAQRVRAIFDRDVAFARIVARENLSRSLAQLTDHGVRVRGREIVIDDRKALEAFARPQPLIDDPSS